MPESFEEQLDRVELMAAGNEKWDLSDNDIKALRAVLKALKDSNAMCKDLAEQLAAVA